MLHFQHDQAGATLRASEVKPKLDRYVIHLFERHGIGLPKPWYSVDANKRVSLRYALRIAPDSQYRPKRADQELHSTPTDDWLKFISLGEGRKVPKPVMWIKGPFKLSIRTADKTYHPERTKLPETEPAKIRPGFCPVCGTEKAKEHEHSLATTLDAVLPYFFATHAFGNRSSRGYGSFRVAALKEGEFRPENIWLMAPPDAAHVFDIELSGESKVPAFDTISDDIVKSFYESLGKGNRDPDYPHRRALVGAPVQGSGYPEGSDKIRRQSALRFVFEKPNKGMLFFMNIPFDEKDKANRAWKGFDLADEVNRWLKAAPTGALGPMFIAADKVDSWLKVNKTNETNSEPEIQVFDEAGDGSPAKIRLTYRGENR